jgi:hypothetical protein
MELPLWNFNLDQKQGLRLGLSRGHGSQTTLSALKTGSIGRDFGGAAFDPAELAQVRHKSRRPRTEGRSIRAQEPDRRQLASLLGSHSQRPRGCGAAEQADELAPPHRPAVHPT